MNRSLTLALPYVFAAIGENTLHVFGVVNILSIPIGKITNNLLCQTLEIILMIGSLGSVP